MPLFLFTKNYPREVEPHPLLLKKPGAGDDHELPAVDDLAEVAAQNQKALLCHHCRKIITSQDQAIEIEGEHLHTFFNPAGIIYELRCFNKAPGCLIYGEPTTEFTWFKAHTWQFCLCRGCLTHLGWFFQSTANSFHGLIKNNLISS